MRLAEYLRVGFGLGHIRAAVCMYLTFGFRVGRIAVTPAYRVRVRVRVPVRVASHAPRFVCEV